MDFGKVLPLPVKVTHVLTRSMDYMPSCREASAQLHLSQLRARRRKQVRQKCQNPKWLTAPLRIHYNASGEHRLAHSGWRTANINSLTRVGCRIVHFIVVRMKLALALRSRSNNLTRRRLAAPAYLVIVLCA